MMAVTTIRGHFCIRSLTYSDMYGCRCPYWSRVEKAIRDQVFKHAIEADQ